MINCQNIINISECEIKGFIFCHSISNLISFRITLSHMSTWKDHEGVGAQLVPIEMPMIY